MKLMITWCGVANPDLLWLYPPRSLELAGRYLLSPKSLKRWQGRFPAYLEKAYLFCKTAIWNNREASMRLMSLLIWGLALLLNSAAANAETVEAANLRGLKSFDILVEDLSDEAARCGVTKNKLDTELLFILGQS